MKYYVKKDNNLFDFLLIHYNKKTVKQLLKFKSVYVNNQNVSQFDYLLKQGDEVEINKEKETLAFDILYEDDEIIVINKPNHMLSMATDTEKDKTAYHLVSQYVKSKNKNNKIFIVHRLDKETSGILLFSKSEKLKNLLQDKWNDLVYLRGYIAIVEGKLNKRQGTIKASLAESKTKQVYVSKEGKPAITNYKVIKERNNYTMLEVFLETGRKNQIRVHMEYIKHPIIGDKKYGSNTNPINRLGLHAHTLGFIHPITKKKMKFTSLSPIEFNKLF